MIQKSAQGASFWFAECTARHIEPEHAAEIMLAEDQRQSWWFRLLDRFGLAPYMHVEVQCDRCKRWRRNSREMGLGKTLWLRQHRVSKTSDSTEDLCPACWMSTPTLP